MKNFTNFANINDRFDFVSIVENISSSENKTNIAIAAFVVFSISLILSILAFIIWMYIASVTIPSEFLLKQGCSYLVSHLAGFCLWPFETYLIYLLVKKIS